MRQPGSRTRPDRQALPSVALLASLLLGCGAEEEPRALEGPAPTAMVESSALVPERTENPPVPRPLRLGDSSWAFGLVQASTPLGTWRAYDRAGSDGVFDIALSIPGASAEPGEAPPGGRITSLELPVGASVRLVAERPTHQTSPSLAAGPAGRVWLAFEEGEADWGRGANLRRARKVVFGEILPSGDFAPQEVPFTDAEAPSLCVDGLGRPWLFARQFESWLPLGKEGQDGTASNRRVAWTLSASVLTAAGWSEPLELPHSDGPEDGALELETTANGVRARYFTDQRRARIDDEQLSGPWDQTLSGAGAWFETRLSFDGGAAPEPTEKVAAPTAERETPTPSASRGASWPGSLCLPTGARVLWGDLHRHTDASRCKMEEDGDLADAYRYALGTARLDFLAVTDHFQHMTPAVFEREVRTADAYDALEGFVAFPGYERALPLGHWTMVAASEPGTELVETAFQPFRPRYLWDDHDPAVWLAIPHQVADRAAPLTWEPTESDLDPVIELYQSRRGAYETRDGWLRDLGGDPDAPWAVDYLAAGRTFGVTASSDHATSDGAFTAVLIGADEEPSRAAIAAALRARRCYATTAPIGLDFELVAAESEERFGMGAEAPAALFLTNGQVRVCVDTRALPQPDLARVELLLGRSGDPGQVLFSWAGPEAERAGRLTLRIGRAKNMRRVLMATEGSVTFEDQEALELERDDLLTTVNGAPALSSSLDERDVDGFTADVRFDAGAALELQIQSGARKMERRFTFEELRSSPSEVFWALGARTELRLDPPPLGGHTFETGAALPPLAAGDWLFVRVVTTSGDAAWSSPIFLR